MSKNNNSKKEEKKKADETVEEIKTDADAAKTAGAEDDGIKDSANAEEEKDAGESKSADQKIDSGKSSKKDPKDAAIEELQDKVKRQMAEFDNFRKRTEKEKSTMFEMGASDIIKKLLPIVDNFERGFKTITDEEKETAFAKGMDMVFKQTLKMLEESGVKPIEAVGLEFNPDLHNAVMHVDDDSVEGESAIVEESEKRHMYRDTVIRHSMVKLAN